MEVIMTMNEFEGLKHRIAELEAENVCLTNSVEEFAKRAKDAEKTAKDAEKTAKGLDTECRRAEIVELDRQIQKLRKELKDIRAQKCAPKK